MGRKRFLVINSETGQPAEGDRPRATRKSAQGTADRVNAIRVALNLAPTLTVKEI